MLSDLCDLLLMELVSVGNLNSVVIFLVVIQVFIVGSFCNLGDFSFGVFVLIEALWKSVVIICVVVWVFILSYYSLICGSVLIDLSKEYVF